MKPRRLGRLGWAEPGESDPGRAPSAAAANSDDFDRLLADIRGCTVCAAHLPLGPRPVVRGRPSARLLIVSQAPGARVHQTGLSFDDDSGDRLRSWLGLECDAFYDEGQVAVTGVGLCYPGRLAKGGDRPPRPECAPLWHWRLRAQLKSVELTVLAGAHAIRLYRPAARPLAMGEAMARWRDFLPASFPLPHPSWRSALWLRANPWFEEEVLPALRARVAAVLSR